MEIKKSASIPREWKSYSLQTTNNNLTFKYPTNVIFNKIDKIVNLEEGVSIYYDTAETQAFVAGGVEEDPLDIPNDEMRSTFYKMLASIEFRK